jgi:hypothetical protein
VLKAELDKLGFLRRYGADHLDLSRLPAELRRMLAEIGRRSTNQALQRADVDRRHPVLLATLAETYVEVLDELVQLLDQALAGADSRATLLLPPERWAGQRDDFCTVTRTDANPRTGNSNASTTSCTPRSARSRRCLGKVSGYGRRTIVRPLAIPAVGRIVLSYREHRHEWPGRSRPVGASGAAVRLAAVSGFLLGGGTGYERGTLGVRGDVLLGVALQASVMAEYLAGGAGDAEGGVGMSELVGASRVSDYAVDGDFGLCRTRRSS